jgi:response regulator RpfG family c-di-GMP phosphodiesterase
MSQMQKILYVEDADDLRELTTFLFQAHFDCQVVEAANSQHAIEILKKDTAFDLIVSDYKMAGGNGDEIYKYLRQNKIQIPFVVLSGNSLDDHPVLSQVKAYRKPMMEEDVIQMVRDNLANVRPQAQKTYIPIPLSLLKKIKDLHCTLYVKINDEKFIKLFHKGTVLNDEELGRHSQHGIATLYIDSDESEVFISDYRRKVLSEQAWVEVQNDDFEDNFKLNAELLRNMGLLLKRNVEFAEITVTQVESALKLISRNKKFNHLVQRFRKIENFGFSDHCTSLVYVAGYILHQLKSEALTHELRMLTLAALIHDVSLDDRLYAMKLNLLFSGRLKDLHKGGADQKEIQAHPKKGAAMAKDFEFCHLDVQTLIEQHHELPDGTGFPAGLKAHEIHPLSAVFIVAEDFVDYFIRYSPAPDWNAYMKSREKTYSATPFREAFRVLKQNIA